jgi:competence protein ComFC
LFIQLFCAKLNPYMSFELFKKVKDSILDLIFPVLCSGCSKEGSYLCESCSKKISKFERQRCLVCQQPSPFGKTHSECAKNKIDGIISALPYSDPIVKNLIANFKYKFVDLSGLLSDFMVTEVKNHELENFLNEFILVPVPLHKKRLAWRGFNQSSLLATHLSDKLGIKLDQKLITRTRNTQPQIELKYEQRKNNTRNAFALNGTVKHKKFLIIDDVVTTGATINEIAKLLKKNKAIEVWALTVAAD